MELWPLSDFTCLMEELKCGVAALEIEVLVTGRIKADRISGRLHLVLAASCLLLLMWFWCCVAQGGREVFNFDQANNSFCFSVT